VFSAFAGTAWAVDIAPEVDPGSIASAVTLLAGGGLLWADRLLKKARAR
jgi:hypothetical protein